MHAKQQQGPKRPQKHEDNTDKVVLKPSLLSDKRMETQDRHIYVFFGAPQQALEAPVTT